MNAAAVYRPVSIQGALEDFDRILGSFFGESPLAPARSTQGFALGFGRPAVDVRELEDRYILEAELPGYDEKTVELHIEGSVLTIASAESAAAEGAAGAEAQGTYVLMERRKPAFKRSFTLPEDADRESVSASFKNGILELEIRKRPEAKRRTIKIEGR